MDVVDTICEYIYESFKTIKGWLEKFEKLMKDKINALLKIVKSTNTLIKKTIGPMVDKINAAAENIRKSIKPLILDVPGKLPYICDDLWKCLALLKELLDDTSALFKSLTNSAAEKCLSENEKNILDHMSDMISDYTKFRDIVCNLGFNFDFCINAMKVSIKTFKLTCINYKKILDKKFKFFDGQLNTIVRYSINAGLGEYLDKLMAFFECAFGVDFPDLNFSLEGEIDLNPCAEIQTAQNFFNEVLATCHLIQEGDGYVIDPAFKAYIFSTVESMMAEIQSFLDNIDKLNEICVNAIELKVATKSYENSKNVWPGDISFSDVRNAVNSIKNGIWRKTNIVKYYSTKYEDVVKSFCDKRANSNNIDDCIPAPTESTVQKKDGVFGLLNIGVSTNLPTSTVENVANAVGIKANLNDSKSVLGGNIAVSKKMGISSIDEVNEFAPVAVRQKEVATDYDENVVKETNENLVKAKVTVGIVNKGQKSINTDEYAKLPLNKFKQAVIKAKTGMAVNLTSNTEKLNEQKTVEKQLINKPGVNAKIVDEHPPRISITSLKELNKRFNTKRYNKHFILKNMKIDDDGTVTIQDGCCQYILDNLPALSNPIVYSMITGDISDNSTILDPATDEIISVTEAAVKIACDPTSDLAIRCKEIWNTINNLYVPQDIVQKY